MKESDIVVNDAQSTRDIDKYKEKVERFLLMMFKLLSLAVNALLLILRESIGRQSENNKRRSD